jgi:hypothetical protein
VERKRSDRRSTSFPVQHIMCEIKAQNRLLDGFCSFKSQPYAEENVYKPTGGNPLYRRCRRKGPHYLVILSEPRIANEKYRKPRSLKPFLKRAFRPNAKRDSRRQTVLEYSAQQFCKHGGEKNDQKGTSSRRTSQTDHQLPPVIETGTLG